MVRELKEQAFFSVVAYVRNDEGIVAETLDRLWTLVDGRFEKFEIILVDDASTDRTAEVIRKYAAAKDKKKITLVSLSRKHGLEVAMQVGLDFSIGDFVLELDSVRPVFDLDKLVELYEKSCEGFDIVSLEPTNHIKVMSSLFYRVLNRQVGMGADINTQLAHLLTRRAINAISKIKDKTSYRKLLHHFVGYRHSVVPVQVEEKIPSSYSLGEKLQMSSDVLFYFTDIGMKLSLYIALLFCFISLLLGAYTVYIYFVRSYVVEGWSTLMLFLSCGFSGVFLVLAIISKYFNITLKEIAALPPYTVKSIEKL